MTLADCSKTVMLPPKMHSRQVLNGLSVRVSSQLGRCIVHSNCIFVCVILTHVYRVTEKRTKFKLKMNGLLCADVPLGNYSLTHYAA